VRVRKGFSTVIAFLLEDIWVVDTMERAQGLWKRGNGFRTLVTLDGDVLEKDGTLTGGGKEGSGFGLLQRRRLIADLKGSVSRLKDRIHRKEKVIGDLTDTLSAKERELEGVLENRHQLEIEFTDCRKDSDQRTQELTRQRQRWEVLVFEGEQLQFERGEKRRELEMVSRQLSELEQKNQEAEKAIGGLKTKLDEKTAALEEIQREVTGLKVDAAAQGEKLKAIEAVLGNLEQSQRGAKDEIAKKLKGVERIRKEMTEAGERIDVLGRSGI